MTNCTIYNSVADGIYLSGEAAHACIVQNNIISEAGGYGIRVANGIAGNHQIDYNCIYNSTTGARSGYTAGDNEITSDPQMTDPANDDFTLGSSSPAIDAGNGTIGAL